MSKLTFTKQIIDSIPLPPVGDRVYYNDAKVAGLQLMVTNTGNKSFKVTRRRNGRLIRVTLGKYPDMPIELARRKACEVLVQIANGENPNDVKRKIRSEITFGEIVEEYLSKHGKLHTKTWSNDERMLQRLAGHLYTRKASAISTRDILSLHTSVGDACGRYQANRVIERMRAIYNKALEWGWEGKNPVINITKFEEKSRDRFLLPDEMPRFLDAVYKESNETARDFILVALLTGARKTNVLTMRWEDINLNVGTWHIRETKNGEAQLIALVPHVIDLLRRRALSDPCPWVFPGKGSKGHLRDPVKAWRRILDVAGIKNLRLHDLRRTLGSWQAALGSSSYIIGKSLGHKSQQATAIYARLNIDPVRESITKATEAMMNGTETDSRKTTDSVAI